MRLTLALLAAVSLCACTAKKIPGTDIDDTGDTRVILDVMTKYRTAFEAKNTAAIMQLLDESFHDDGGSSSADDDLDYSTFSTKLPRLFSKADDLRLDITVKKVEFDEEQNAAKVTYTYTESFRAPQLTSKTYTEPDIKQMYLRRAGDKNWKIVSGI